MHTVVKLADRNADTERIELNMKKLLGIVVLGLLWCNVGFADDQAKRKELIDKMINTYHIVEKIEIPGSLPRVWVTSQFHRLTFSDKKTFIHLIYSYYYTKNPKYDIIKIFDNITGKSIGTYTPSLGLRIKY